jgi:uncharacterized membrane protein
MNTPNASGVLATGSAIKAAKRIRVSGAVKAVVKAWFNRLITSGGVAAGATKPHQVSTVNPGSVCARLGTLGKASLRWAVVTPKASSLSARMLVAAVAKLSILKSTCPDNRASCTGCER